MKKRYFLVGLTFVFFSVISSSFSVADGAERGVSYLKPSVSATSAVLIDVGTGQILYNKNMHEKRPIASTTPIITSILAIESGQLNQLVTVGKRASEVDQSSINLKANEKLSLKNLLFASMLSSSNDACGSIAEHIAGSEHNFVNLMNLFAQKLGCSDTHFANSNGLPNQSHYSSAYDMAMMTKYAMKDPVFCQIVGTKYCEIKNEKGAIRKLTNANKLLWSYNGINGVKAGFTNEPGECLVSSAERNGRQLICVVLHSNARYHDSIKLLDYGFDQFSELKIISRGEYFTSVRVENGINDWVPILAGENLYVLIPKVAKGTFEQKLNILRLIKAPVNNAQRVGKLSVIINQENIREINLITGNKVDKKAKYLSIYENMSNNL